MKTRKRSAAYRARRRVRSAWRRLRAAERNDAFVMLERMPGFADMLERNAALERAFEETL